MVRSIALITIIFIALPTVTASGPLTTADALVTILPEDCQIQAGGELVLELGGHLPPEAVATWDANYGTVASVLPGTSAVLVAPSTPAVITIYVTISNTAPDRWIYATRQCTVFLPVDF